MWRKVLALFLTGGLLAGRIPMEISATGIMQEKSQASTMAAYQQDRAFPIGGIKEQKAVPISREEIEDFGLSLEEDSASSKERAMESLVRGSKKYDSSWDIYSSNYMYNCLNKEEKGFWDDLDYLCRKYLTTNKDAKHCGLVNPDDNNNLYWYYLLEPGISYASRKLSDERISDLVSLFMYTNPQYYFLEWYAGNSETKTIFPYVYDEFGKGSGRKAGTAKMKKAIDEMEKEIASGKTDVEKVQIAHDLVIKNVKYDQMYATPYEKTHYHQCAYSVFCDGYTICAGYAKAFELLMNGAGIDSFAVVGNNHAWNMVCLNGSWYHVDCTWDDMDGNGGRDGRYLYFNRSTSMINQLDTSGAHQVLPLYQNYIPKSVLDSGATDDDIGTYQKQIKRSEKPVISQKKVSGGLQITLKSATAGAKIYYTLDGTRPSSAFTRCYQYKRPFRVSTNVTVKAIAVCDAKKDSEISTSKVYGRMYKVKFHTMGGSKIPSQKVYANSKLKRPPKPKYAGYQFAGWYRDKACKRPWNFKKKVIKDMTLYAKWKKQ